MMGIVSSFLGPAFIPEDFEPVLVVAAEGPEVGQHFKSRKLLFNDGLMVSIMSLNNWVLGLTFIPEDLQSVLAIAADGAKVNKHFE
jgi:hypothetical protein